ncbi:MAG: accessory factor UbiK family protein [Emcibacter sp.]|nr:accessory factor UbiK family protein [Emcibacter sp.]
MQTDNKFFDDLAKLGQSAVGTLHGVKSEIESAIHARLEQALMTMDIVSREEYDVVLDMAKEARAKNLELEQKIIALEKKLNAVKTSKNKTSKEVKK